MCGFWGAALSDDEIDWTIAHHEAGHIVAARLLGLSISDATMEPTNDTNFAEVQTKGATWLSRNAGLTDQLKALAKDFKVALARPHAEMKYRPDIERKEQISKARNWGYMKTAIECVAFRRYVTALQPGQRWW
jgi:hypothetical protein